VYGEHGGEYHGADGDKEGESRYRPRPRGEQIAQAPRLRRGVLCGEKGGQEIGMFSRGK